MVDVNWLTEEYLNDLGYYKLKDDGQYGIYKNKHFIVKCIAYGNLPKDYRTIKFNRDANIGIFLSISSDWETRFSMKNAIAINKEIFEILLNACV